MTSYITQTIARQHVAELITAAEAGRVRRELRRGQREARRAERTAQRNERLANRGASNGSELWPTQFGYAAAR
ncbi:hypothetical protein [Nocardioides pocheonensis]|uniref:Uncharacterized protein n=1 Tax=Nocardioides pocheonensis TaxID=661485 RepID=A0A3N0GPI5_9ACTN|nr:hypothetical protein [Nocardioides pocheonensis]RNM14068.1 hypothetical protein EFL26_14110 [Nocardioides pocheonensis]